MLVKNTTMPFLKRGTVLKEKVDFILSKLNIIPHFMSFETQLLTRPITAGYNWIKTPFSIFIGHYLTKFCNKFDSTLLDSTRSSQFGFLFTLDFKSLYTLSKNKGGFLFRKKRTFIPKIILTVFIFSILYRRRLCWVCWGTWPEGKNSAKNTSTASRTQRKEHESEKATEIKPLSTTDKVESLFGSNATEKGEKWKIKLDFPLFLLFAWFSQAYNMSSAKISQRFFNKQSTDLHREQLNIERE